MMKPIAVLAFSAILLFPPHAHAAEPDAVTGASYDPPFPLAALMDVQEAAREWIAKHWLMSVATAEPDGAPHVSGVVYISDGFTVYFLGRKNSNKVRNIRHDPRVSYTIWDPVSNFRDLKALQVAGEATILAGEERERIGKELVFAPGSRNARTHGPYVYPHVQEIAKDTPIDPDFEVIAVRPRIARWNDNTVAIGNMAVIDLSEKSMDTEAPVAPRP